VFKNIPYFLTNYLMVMCVFTIFTLLMAPLMALLISLPLLCYWYLFVWRHDVQYTVPVIGYQCELFLLLFSMFYRLLFASNIRLFFFSLVGDREKYIAVGIVSLLVFLFAASDLIWLVGLTAVFVGVHSVCYATQDEWELATAFDSDPV
jgi:hypothetical protein